jgi:hypothetical protein
MDAPGPEELAVRRLVGVGASAALDAEDVAG